MAKETFGKEVDRYEDSANNYFGENEIRVTITLNEYRELVTVKATTDSRVKKAEEDKWLRENENKNLKEENAKLKAELYELQKKLAEEECGDFDEEF